MVYIPTSKQEADFIANYDASKYQNPALAADVTDFVDVYGLVSPYTSFQNLAFNTNPTINAPNQGLGLAARCIPCPRIHFFPFLLSLELSL